MNKRQIPGWSVLAAALIVAIAAAAAITKLRQEADKILQAERLLIHLEAQAYRLSSLEDHAISEQKLDLETVESVQAVRSRLQETLERVFQLVPSGQSLQQVTKSYREYITAVDDEFLLIKAGRFAQARTLDKQRVNPSFEVLSKEVADLNATYRDMVYWTLQKADTGSALTLIFAATAIGLLLWRLNSAQRNAQIQLVRSKCLHNLEVTPTIELQFQHSKGHWCYVEQTGGCVEVGDLPIIEAETTPKRKCE